MEIFINQSFIEKYYFNIYKLSNPISIYNINGISNKYNQISKVVDIML